MVTGPEGCCWSGTRQARWPRPAPRTPRGLPSDPLSWALAPTHGAPSPLFCLTLAGGAASIGRGEDVGAGMTEGPGFAAAQRQGAVTWPLPLLGWLPALAARAPPRALCGPCSRFNSIPPKSHVCPEAENVPRLEGGSLQTHRRSHVTTEAEVGAWGLRGEDGRHHCRPPGGARPTTP